MTRKTARKTAVMQMTSLRPIFSPRIMTPKMQAMIGLRLQTMPTVDTLKKLRLLKEIYTDKPPCKHLNIKLGSILQFRGSINLLFAWLLTISKTIREQTTPRRKVNCIMATSGADKKSYCAA